MKKRSNDLYPLKGSDLPGFIEKAWTEGWFDEYSNEHFLIRAINNQVDDIEWKVQLLNNNTPSMYSPISQNGKIDFKNFSSKFVINLSMMLLSMSNQFGEDNIKKFIKGQLSAGKQGYDRDQFFQALSEIEILGFYCSRGKLKAAIYEPSLGINGSNPEAKFVVSLPNSHCSDEFEANIEVKTPKFPIINEVKTKSVIPTILLTKNGRAKVKELCKENDFKCIPPRVTKLVQFINSATKKFEKPKENEFNLLYINWSYSDFPSNGFLEAWSLLANEVNGILTHPEVGSNLPFNEPVCIEAYEKITAVIVYTSSLEQLMFSCFQDVWKRSEKAGPRFRMLVLNKDLYKKEMTENLDALRKLTGMNPDTFNPREYRLLLDYNWKEETTAQNKGRDCKFAMDLVKLVNENLLKFKE